MLEMMPKSLCDVRLFALVFSASFPQHWTRAAMSPNLPATFTKEKEGGSRWTCSRIESQ
jgi:hypothetical protein